jgi:hypothetical protein
MNSEVHNLSDLTLAQTRLRLLRGLVESEGFRLARAMNQEIIDTRATQLIRTRCRSQDEILAQEFDKGHIEGREQAFADLETEIEVLKSTIQNIQESLNESEDPQVPVSGSLL